MSSSTCARATHRAREATRSRLDLAPGESLYYEYDAPGGPRARHDRVFRIDADVAELKARIPSARETVYPDAGHLIPVERPKRFTRDLIAFAEGL